MPKFHCTAIGFKDGVGKVAREYHEQIDAKDFDMAFTLWLNHLKVGPVKEGFTLIEVKIIESTLASELFSNATGLKTKPILDLRKH